MSVRSIPDGYEGVTPYLICKNAEAAIEYYKRAFGATELFRIGSPGMVGHKWTFATHKEDVSPEEMNKRAAAMYGG